MGDEKKKRAATGKIYKYKARLNIGGHKQVKHVNYWQTYSPVIGWPIVRLFLTLSIIHGQKQAGRVWNQRLHKGLTEIGFTQSEYEECVYFRNVTILPVYDNDLIIMSHEESDVDKVFHDIQAAGFDINCVGALDEYLGIEVQRLKNGNIHLKQPTIIKKILQDLGFNHKTKSKPNPAKIATMLNKATKEPPHDAT